VTAASTAFLGDLVILPRVLDASLGVSSGRIHAHRRYQQPEIMRVVPGTLPIHASAQVSPGGRGPRLGPDLRGRSGRYIGLKRPRCGRGDTACFLPFALPM